MSLPDSVKCKLFRAQEHLEAIKSEALRYYEKNPAKLVRQPEGSPDEFIGKIVTDSPIPMRIPLMIGDFLQNLRSSLDYLVWELVLAAKNRPAKDNMFPICTTPRAFDDQVARRRLDGIDSAAMAEIRALQPYHDPEPEENVLFMIDNLCNINKHRRVVTTFMRGCRAPNDFVRQEINGETFATVNFWSLRNQDTKVGPFPIVNGRYGPGPKVDAPLELVSFIALGEGAAQDAEIGIALSTFLGFVAQELARFDKFFI